MRRGGAGGGDLVAPEGARGEGLLRAGRGEVGVGPGAVGVAGERGVVALDGDGRGYLFIFVYFFFVGGEICGREEGAVENQLTG